MSLVYCCSALWWGWRQKQALVQRRTIWWRHRNLHARTTNSRREYCCWQTRTVSYQKRCTCDSLIINTFIHLKNRKYWVKNSLIIIAVVRIVLTLEYQNSLIVCVRLVLFEQHIQCRPKPPPQEKVFPPQFSGDLFSRHLQQLHLYGPRLSSLFWRDSSFQPTFEAF